MQNPNKIGPVEPQGRAGFEAALLASTEIGWGGILHAFQVPLAGHFLSLNQTFLLSVGVARRSRTRLAESSRLQPVTVSNVAALLKTLSPAGQKLTPMLAISAQGLLFTLGTVIFGANFAGAAAGSMIASVWAFAQPLLIYYFIFGRGFIESVVFYSEKFLAEAHLTGHVLLAAIVALVALKILAALTATVLAWRLPREKIEIYLARLTLKGRSSHGMTQPASQTSSSASAAKGALRDLCKPVFLIWLALTIFFFAQSESSKSEVIWKSLRPVAVGFLFFYFARRISWERVIAYFERSRFKNFARHFRAAVESLRQT